ncbi:MAG TPA: type III pantothenate kinase [Rhodanobacteraceae bacterium]|nr:type III pantothenate kinase [Rhodanobacteraceae bacterium]
MKWLMDLGNTRIKWVMADADTGAGQTQAMAWQDDMATAMARTLANSARPQSVWAASVVDAEREAAVEAAARTCFGLPVTWVRTPAEACGVRNAYAQPEALGVDRFLGMVAAHAEGRDPCVLVSCGTALVLDALAADGQHLGGLIAPGPGLMQQAVLGATAQVRPQSPGQLADVAASTADALVSGSWQACAALADRFIARMAGRLGDTPQVLLGGGDAHALEPLLEHAVTIYPDAVLKGLAVWAGESLG